MLGMSMRLDVSQQLSLRQTLEAQLAVQMSITQKLVLELRLYLKREDECKRLYADALERGDVHQYQGHGLTFEYARVRREEVPSHILNLCGCGFAHCLYNGWDALLGGTKFAMARGSWLLFVVADYFAPVGFPEEFLQYIAVHEHGEEVTLGEHHLATKLEFAVAKRERKLARYIDWLESHSPGKFTDVFSHHSRIELPDSNEFQRLLEKASRSEHATRVRQMIENFEWPAATLQKLDRYEKQGRELQQALITALTRLTQFANDLPISWPLPEAKENICQQLTAVVQVGKEQARYLCLQNFQPIYQLLRRDLALAYAKYRVRRQDVLQLRPDGQDIYLAEIKEGGEALPTSGVFSLNFREAMEAL